MSKQSLQDFYAPKSICFGCGPANEKGLHIKSFVQDDGKVMAKWRAEPHHQAFPGVLNGGIVGALLDCHSNWTASYHLMQKNSLSAPPCTVTANFAVKLQRPTPFDKELILEAQVESATETSATTFATLSANGKVCATMHGTFVMVKPDHPAYHRW